MVEAERPRGAEQAHKGWPLATKSARREVRSDATVLRGDESVFSGHGTRVRRVDTWLLGKTHAQRSFRWQRDGAAVEARSNAVCGGDRETRGPVSAGVPVRHERCAKTWAAEQQVVARSAAERDVRCRQ